MKLNDEGLKNRQWWEEKGYSLPQYDRETVRKATKENPFWIHFGGGNIFRAFQANVVQNLLNDGVLDRGLTVAEGYDYEIIQKMYHPHDDLSILVTLKSTGTIEPLTRDFARSSARIPCRWQALRSQRRATAS